MQWVGLCESLFQSSPRYNPTSCDTQQAKEESPAFLLRISEACAISEMKSSAISLLLMLHFTHFAYSMCAFNVYYSRGGFGNYATALLASTVLLFWQDVIAYSAWLVPFSSVLIGFLRWSPKWYFKKKGDKNKFISYTELLNYIRNTEKHSVQMINYKRIPETKNTVSHSTTDFVQFYKSSNLDYLSTPWITEEFCLMTEKKDEHPDGFQIFNSHQ